MIILKVSKKHVFSLYLENTFWEKPQGKVRLTPPRLLSLCQALILLTPGEFVSVNRDFSLQKINKHPNTMITRLSKLPLYLSI